MNPLPNNRKPFRNKLLWRALLSSVTISLLCFGGKATGYSAIVTFQDDFEGHTPGEAPGAPWTAVSDGPGSGSVTVIQDENDLFGKGTTNQILEYRKDGTDSAQNLVTEETFSAEVARIRFNFFQPEDEFDEHSWIILYAGSRSTGNRAQVMNFGADGDTIGSSAIYDRGVVNQLELIVNNSNDPFSYSNGQTVEPGTVDIWINEVLAEEGFSAQNNQRGAITTFEFNTSSSRQQAFFIDDMVIVPEPRAVGAVFGVVALGAVFVLRRRSSRRL